MRGRVVFAGESGEVPALLSAMDVFAAPSEEETFGLAVIEALASGLPVLYGACPALEELPGDSAPAARRMPPEPKELGLAIAALLAGSPERHAPPPAVAHYDIRHHVTRLEALYTRVQGEQ